MKSGFVIDAFSIAFSGLATLRGPSVSGDRRMPKPLSSYPLDDHPGIGDRAFVNEAPSPGDEAPLAMRRGRNAEGRRSGPRFAYFERRLISRWENVGAASRIVRRYFASGNRSIDTLLMPRTDPELDPL